MESESESEIMSECKRCKNCLVCCFKVLYEYNLYSEAYKNVYKMIKIVLTLSVTQVQCERTFNILKYIKNHLRNRLTDDHVDALHIMNGNKDLLLSIENEAIIKEICNGSSEFTKNLLI